MRFLWLGAELAIVACEMAEVLGSALALHLLLGVSITTGIVITAFDTVLVLGLQGAGFRRVEAIVLGLVLTIAACFAVELVMVQPHWLGVAMGFVPSLERLRHRCALPRHRHPRRCGDAAWGSIRCGQTSASYEPAAAPAPRLPPRRWRERASCR